MSPSASASLRPQCTFHHPPLPPPLQDDMRWMSSMWAARPGFDSSADVTLEYAALESASAAGLRSVSLRMPGHDMGLLHTR